MQLGPLGLDPVVRQHGVGLLQQTLDDLRRERGAVLAVGAHALQEPRLRQPGHQRRQRRQHDAQTGPELRCLRDTIIYSDIFLL